MHNYKYRVLSLLILLSLNFKSYAADVDLIDFERVLSLQAKNARLTYSEFILSFEIDDKLYINAKEFIVSIGFNLDIADDSTYIFRWDDKKQTIEINFSDCFYKHESKINAFDCSSIITHEDEKYLQKEIINQILDSEIEYFPRRSQLLISSETDFPKLKIDQLKRNVLTSPNARSFNADRTVSAPYQWLDGFSYYQEMDINRVDSAFQKMQTLSHFGSLDAELAKMQLKVNNAGDENTFENQWVALSRQSHEEDLLGFLSSSEFTLGNFFTPNSRHHPSGSKLLGINFHNRSLNNSNLTRFETFEGDIKPGWVVELYRNNILIDKQIDIADNRYRFEQVPLNFGLNQFVFIFYGPSGEELREERALYLDSSTLSNKPITYNFASGQNEDHQNITVAQADIPFSSLYLLSLAHYESKDTRVFQSELNANIFNSSLILSNAFDNEGQVYGGEILRRFSQVSFSGDYFIYDDFTADERSNLGLQQRFRSSLTFPFMPRTQHLINYAQEKRRGIDKDSFRYRISHNWGRLYLNSEIQAQDSVYNLRSLIRIRLQSWQLSSEGSYDENGRFDSATIGARYKQDRDRSLAATFSRFFSTKQNFFSISAQQVFSKFLARVSFDTTFMGDSRIVLGFATSFFGDTKSNHYSLRSRYALEVGDILIRTYIDENENKTPVENVCFNSLTSRERVCSDENGVARLVNLSTNNPTRLQLEFSDITNFYINSDERSFEVYVRPGKTTHLEVPLKIYGELEGNIYGLGSNAESYQIHIEALESDYKTQLRTDGDGYFYLSKVRPGRYKSTLLRNSEALEVKFFEMPEEGDLIALDFQIL
jgi:hypothetical protein